MVGTDPTDDASVPPMPIKDGIPDLLRGATGADGANGANGADGATGAQGPAGADGTEIVDVTVDEAGVLTLFMSDFTTRTATGRVAGPTGENVEAAQWRQTLMD